MTQPRLAYQKSGREYRWPARPPHELAVPSNTTIINGGVPKDALKFWAAKMAAQYAVQHRDAWKDLPPEDAVDLIKRAATRFTERKANLGDAVHSAIEVYLGNRGEPKGLNDLERQYFHGALSFLRDLKVEIIRVESTVFSRAHGYAGTFDLLYKTPALPGPVVGDWKTSKAIYGETSLQLVASAKADFIADPDGKTEHPIPEDIEWGTTIRLGPEGEYEPVPFRLTDELFEIFLAAKVVTGREGVFRSCREIPLAPVSDDEQLAHDWEEAA